MSSFRLRHACNIYARDIQYLCSNSDIKTISEFRRKILDISIPKNEYLIDMSFYTNTFKSSIVHIPLEVNPYEVSVSKYIQTKMLIWETNALIDRHNHPGVHCIFVPIGGELFQGIYSSHESCSRIDLINKNSYSYIHDSMGEHTLANHLKHMNVSLHTYIDERFFTER